MNFGGSRSDTRSCCLLSALTTLTMLLALTTPATPCLAPFFSYGGSCFYLHNVTATLKGHTYADSRTVCRNFGGDLAKIDSRNVSRLVEGLFADVWVSKYQSYWIGLDDLTTEGSFRWTGDDRSELSGKSFTNWRNVTLEKSGSGRCVRLTVNGTWVRSRCELLFGFVFILQEWLFQDIHLFQNTWADHLRQ